MPVTTSLPLQGVFVSDPVHSSFQFAVTHMQVGRYRAGFDDFEVRVTAAAGTVQLEGTIEVESISIKNPPQFREHVVNGPDFFDATNHPTISFRSAAVTLEGDGTFTGDGTLTMRGVSKDVAVVGTYQPLVEDPYGAQRTAVEFSSTVDRRDWGMDWQMPLPGGADALGYQVVLTAHVELVQQA